MSKKETVNTPFFKKMNIIDFVFYVSFLCAIVVSILYGKEHLLYIMPIVILSIIVKYISLTKSKARPIVLFALLASLASDILSFLCFENCFASITVLTSLYILGCAVSLKKYLYTRKPKAILSFSVVISVLLIAYILYSVLELLVSLIHQEHLFFVFLCALSLIIYTITFAIVYINDNYNNGIVLLASGLFTFFQIVLVAINEFLYYNNTFTVLVITCHIMAIYLYMTFIAKTKDIKSKEVN